MEFTAATDASKLEGNSGNTAFTFTVSRTGDTSGSTNVAYAVTGSGSNPASLSQVRGDVLTSITNSGTWSDPESGNVTLSASLGAVVKNADGTWSWSLTSPTALINQTITITATDDGSLASSVAFSLNAIPAVSNRKVYYKNSWFASAGADVPAALDPSKVIAKSGATPQTLSYLNLTSNTQGINGLVLDVAGLVSNSLTASDFGLRMSPAGYFNKTDNPPSSWLAAPNPTGIFVTPGTATTPARVRLEWADNDIENRWLQIRIFAAKTGLPSTEVYYIGHLKGEIDGEIVAGAYFVSNADLTGVLPVGQLATVDNVRDVDKDRFVLNADLVVVRTGITSGSILRNITIPIAGSANEGAGTGNLAGRAIASPAFLSSGSVALVARSEPLLASLASNLLRANGQQSDLLMVPQGGSLDSTQILIDESPLSKNKTTDEENETLRLDDVFSYLADGTFEEKILDLDFASSKDFPG